MYNYFGTDRVPSKTKRIYSYNFGRRSNKHHRRGGSMLCIGCSGCTHQQCRRKVTKFEHARDTTEEIIGTSVSVGAFHSRPPTPAGLSALKEIRLYYSSHQ
jgi:hypothetical protein